MQCVGVGRGLWSDFDAPSVPRFFLFRVCLFFGSRFLSLLLFLVCVCVCLWRAVQKIARDFLAAVDRRAVCFVVRVLPQAQEGSLIAIFAACLILPRCSVVVWRWSILSLCCLLFLSALHCQYVVV